MQQTQFELLKSLSDNTQGRHSVSLLSLSSVVGNDIISVNDDLVELQKGKYLDSWRTTEKASEHFILSVTDKGRAFVTQHEHVC